MNRRLLLLVPILVVGLVVVLRPAWLAAAWQVLNADSINALATYLRSFGVWTPLVSVGLMILQSVVAPLPGSLVVIANSIVFGVWWGTLFSWIGGILGATANFWIARWLGQAVAMRLAGRALGNYTERFSQANGFWLLLGARLIPVLSFDVLSYLAGLSRMSFARFLLATALGMIPGTLAWTILGHDLAYAQSSVWRICFVALFALITLFGGRWWLRRQH